MDEAKSEEAAKIGSVQQDLKETTQDLKETAQDLKASTEVHTIEDQVQAEETMTNDRRRNGGGDGDQVPGVNCEVQLPQYGSP